MSNQKNRELPNAAMLQDAYDRFSKLSNQIKELNDLYLEQAKQFWQRGIVNTKTLYQVSTPDEFVKTFSALLTENGALVSKTLLDDTNALLKICHDVCNSSVGCSDEIRTSSLKFFDFYSKLLPSPAVYKFDDMVKNAASGNHQSIHALHEIVKNAMSSFGSAVQSSANATLDSLNSISKNAKK
jgi:hypothetical protein